MKNIYLYVGHRDLVGGGQLVLYYLAGALTKWFHVYLSDNFNLGMKDYEFLDEFSFRIGKPQPVDIFIHCQHTQYHAPIGRYNISYTHFPRYEWDMSGYQKILANSDYSRQYVRKNWKRDAEVLVGGVFYPDYHPADKENIIFNSSRFLLEGNAKKLEVTGSCKGQHYLIEAFMGLDIDYQLILSGSVLCRDDHRYLNACKRLAEDDSRIAFLPMLPKDQTSDLYSRSKLFCHAMGYGSRDAAEVEHYGFCVQKAVLSDCYTIVHDSGGAPEIADDTFKSLEELKSKTINFIKTGSTPTHFKDTRERFFGRVEEIFRDLV